MDPRLKVVNHIIALFQEAFEVMEQIRNAPESPVTSYLPAKMRRAFRHNAKRLRDGRAVPKYPNVTSADELAFRFQSAADRDDTIERCIDKLTRISQEIARVRQYHAAELEEGTRIVYHHAWQRAQEDGPDSKAADFFRLFQEMIAKGHELRTLKRREKEIPLPREPFRLPGADPALELRESIFAAEILPEGPAAGERVHHFPAEAAATDERPIVMRIGIEEKAWVGSFRRGTTDYCTVQLMPDGAHILVVSHGAGYVVEAVTRSLAAEAGTDIMQVIQDVDAGFLFIDHAGACLDGFGTTGLLWKTGRIGAGGFRDVGLGDGFLSGETRQSSDGDWTEFSVDLGTGEVSWSDL